MKLSLGPIQYFWSHDDLVKFYQLVADMPVDVVYLGETVCSKRRLFRFEDWMNTAQLLKEAGKQVVISTMALLEAESELKTLRRICNNGAFLVEANDMAAVQLLSAADLPFVAGPMVNIYNARTLQVLANAGLKRWVLPLELGKETLQSIQKDAPEGVEVELFVWGRMPLAMSARCYTARAHDLPKDDCQYRCLDDVDGLTMRTREAEPFLTINGIQTQSALTCNLLPELAEIKKSGVDVLRISPQYYHTDRIVNAFHKAMGSKESDQDLPDMQRFMPVGGCDGYWHEQAGMHSSTSK